VQRNKLRYKSMSEFEEAFPRHLKSRMGRGLYIGGRAKAGKDRYKYKIGNSFPDIIDDLKTNKRTVRFHNFETLFIADVKKTRGGKVVVSFPERDVIAGEMEKRLESITIRSESALLETIYDRILDIASVQLAMTPIKDIVVSIHRNNELDFKEFAQKRNKAQALRYVEFLAGLDYITREDGKLLPGKQMRKSRELGSLGDKQLYQTFLSDILAKGYGYIQDYLHLTQIVPYLRVSNSYFLPSHASGGLLHLSEDEIRKHYRFYYQKSKPIIKIRGQVNEVVEAKIFEREDEYIVGNRNIWKEYSKAVGSL
jgi:hypothetical protein